MQPIIFALISYLGWGIGDIFGTIAARKIGGYSTTFWYLVIQLILSLALAPFFLSDLKNLTVSILLVNLLLGLMGTAGLVTFYEGLRVGSASLVGTISASFVAVVVLLSIVFLKETLILSQAISVMVILGGIIISSLDLKELTKRKLLKNRGVILALATMLLWGAYWSFIKIPISQIGWYWPRYFRSVHLPGHTDLFAKFRKLHLANINRQKSFVPLFLNALLLSIGAFTFNYAISKGLVSVVAPIAGSYPTLFVLLSFLVFKDKISKQQIAGIIITLIGIVLLSINSV